LIQVICIEYAAAERYYSRDVFPSRRRPPVLNPRRKVPMRIGMILKGNIPPPDIRIEKEASTLIREGHEVNLLLERRKGEAREMETAGIRCVRGVHMGRLREILHRYTFSFTFRDPAWRRAIREFAVSRSVEVLHVHDLPLVREAISVGRELGIPVVADMHENYPGGLQVWYTSRLKKKTIYNFNRWARYEREILLEADAVIAVIEESKERLKALGIPEEKIFVVPNTSPVESIDIPLDQAIIGKYRDLFMVSYIGGFAPHRGLDTSIRALPHLRGRIPDMKLVLVGDRNKPYMEYLVALAEKLGVSDMVEMTGWQPFEKIWSYIAASRVCLVPHARNPHTDTTIPHKIFQYMMIRKPVVVSDCPPLKRIIEDSGGGLVFRHDSPEELAECIARFREDGEFSRQAGERGRAAFLDRYNWDSTSGDLKKLYGALARRAEKS